MELEEAKFRTKILMADLKNASENIPRYKENFLEYREALEIVFNELENRIPKKKIKDDIKAYEKLINDIGKSEHYSHEIPLYRHDIQVLQNLLEEK